MIPNVRLWYDKANAQYKITVVGSASSNVNISGNTYQYTAFCDPGMRFNICGAFVHGTGATSPRANPLLLSDFSADAGFVQRETASASAVNGLYFRTDAYPGNDASLFGGVYSTTAFNLNTAGQLDSASALMGPPCNYSVWRTADSGNAALLPMIQITSYTGNGAGSRTITLTPTSGRVPLFVMVTTSSGTTSMRDGSHTGSNSANCDSGANSTTGITAVAIDQITVGSSMNTNLQAYYVFAICGDVVAGNGTFIGDYAPGIGASSGSPFPAPALVPLGTPPTSGGTGAGVKAYGGALWIPWSSVNNIGAG